MLGGGDRFTFLIIADFHSPRRWRYNSGHQNDGDRRSEDDGHPRRAPRQTHTHKNKNQRVTIHRRFSLSAQSVIKLHDCTHSSQIVGSFPSPGQTFFKTSSMSNLRSQAVKRQGSPNSCELSLTIRRRNGARMGLG